ncbi:MAG: hypothetical protein NTW26_01105 [bacterium]|nr:hypothetical protein [bacterium]
MSKYVSIAVAALFTCLSCSTGTDGDGNGTVLETLNKFMDVWNSGDVDAYESLLTDDFTFYFDPRDVGYHDIPESWGLVDEMTAYNNLFDAVGAENVQVQLDLDGVTEPEEGAETYKVENIEYDVLVFDENADPEPIMYLATGLLDMELMKVDGEWVIINWWDKASLRLPGVEECTWGEIKALYYK